MLFQKQTVTADRMATAFREVSGGIYNRWDYDAATGKYLRFEDAADDVTAITSSTLSSQTA